MKKVLLTVGVITALTLGTSIFASAGEVDNSKNGNGNFKSSMGKQKNGGCFDSLNKKSIDEIKETILNRKIGIIDEKTQNGEIPNDASERIKEAVTKKINEVQDVEALKNFTKGGMDIESLIVSDGISSGKTLEEIKTEIINRKSIKIDSRVAEGVITKEVADQKKEKIKDEIGKANSEEELKNALENNKGKNMNNKGKNMNGNGKNSKKGANKGCKIN